MTDPRSSEPASAGFGLAMLILLVLAVLYAFSAYFDLVPGPLG